jgi:topoisomerase-4 subunit A
VILKSKGISTLSGRKIWFDEVLKRLNTDARGKYLGTFSGEDQILAIYGSGAYELTNFDLTNHYDDDLKVIRKFKEGIVASAVHWDGAQKLHFVKRFIIEAALQGKKVSFINEAPGSKLTLVSIAEDPQVVVKFAKDKKWVYEPMEIHLAEFIDVKGLKAQGNKLSNLKVAEVILQETTDEEVVEDSNEEGESKGSVPLVVEDKRDGAKGSTMTLF